MLYEDARVTLGSAAVLVLGFPLHGGSLAQVVPDNGELMAQGVYHVDNVGDICPFFHIT